MNKVIGLIDPDMEREERERFFSEGALINYSLGVIDLDYFSSYMEEAKAYHFFWYYASTANNPQYTTEDRFTILTMRKI